MKRARIIRKVHRLAPGLRVIQTASACMAANLRIEQIAELQPAFPTFTEGITVAAATIVRQMGLAPTAPSWGELQAGDPTPLPPTA